ncbi:MAG: hypothetical protein WBK55_00950 [Alphaproteobacteria bacterium]
MSFEFNPEDYPYRIRPFYPDISEEYLNYELCRLCEAQKILEIPMLIIETSEGFEMCFQTKSQSNDFQRIAFPADNCCPSDPCLN